VHIDWVEIDRCRCVIYAGVVYHNAMGSIWFRYGFGRSTPGGMNNTADNSIATHLFYFCVDNGLFGWVVPARWNENGFGITGINFKGNEMSDRRFLGILGKNIFMLLKDDLQLFLLYLRYMRLDLRCCQDLLNVNGEGPMADCMKGLDVDNWNGEFVFLNGTLEVRTEATSGVQSMVLDRQTSLSACTSLS